MPASTPPAPPPVFGRADIRKKTRSRTTRRLFRIGLVVAAAIVVIAGAGIGYAEYISHKIHRVVVNDLVAQPPSGVENIVLVGSTSRCALKQQNKAFGLCSEGVTGVNSDVVMILHVDPTKHTAAILSIPRDLFVPNARATGANKIDAALVEGPQQLVSAIEEDFGIPINHYVELNFDSFQGVVNALGGIKMYFPEPVFDAYSGLNVPAAGCRPLNGFQALEVVRARHLVYKGPNVKTNNHADWTPDPQSDLSRIRRDHEFLRVLATAVDKKGLGNPITDHDLLLAVAPQLQVDSALSLSSMFGLVTTFHDINIQKTPQQTLPVIVLSSLSYLYQGYDYGNVELTSQPADLQAISSFLGIGTDTNTMTGKLLPSPGSVTVSVLNGTGLTGQAGKTASALDALGFNVVGEGDSPASGSLSETYVYYSSPSHLADAEQVLHSLSGTATLGKAPTSFGADVTVVTGSNFAVNAPTPAKSSSSGSKTTATTPTTSAPTVSTLQAPTPLSQALAPFDPRSCTASGAEGS
ncbi:MAG TPA: LCP family protein [Acidimicrobiales bacterium]|nr:LCP family protein [Acidimicrobiales bacterium]